MANVSKTKVITGKNTRLSYFHGWEPTSINGGPERYSVSVLIPKDDKETVKAINDAIDAAIEEGIAKFGGKSLTRQQSSFLFVMVTQNVRTRLMPDIGSSMLTVRQHHRLLIRQ